VTKGNDEFFAGVKLALDPYITFGVKKVPEKGADDPNTGGLRWSDFKVLANMLAERRLTGDAARSEIEIHMAHATVKEWNGWYRRILIKDLRCGVSEKTINSVVGKDSKYFIPTFTCQLAHDSANHEGKVVGKKQLEVKLDGVRVITIAHPDGRVEMFSRNGKELVNFQHIADQIGQVAKGQKQAMVYDGEVMSDSFQDLMKQVHRKSDVAAGDAVLHLFDVVTLEEFRAGSSLIAQSARSTTIRDWVEANQTTLKHVKCLDWIDVDLDTVEGQEQFKAVNKRAIAGGYEGIMIKDPDAGYECKRSHAWLKLKPFIEVTLEVRDVEEGTGRNAGRLGALVCNGTDDGREITVNVGSGFTDDLRTILWTSRTSVLRQLVEVRADAITQNQDGSYSLRFPRFIRFRGFEPGEKL
jgi:DNA ligase-1